MTDHTDITAELVVILVASALITLYMCTKCLIAGLCEITNPALIGALLFGLVFGVLPIAVFVGVFTSPLDWARGWINDD